METKKKAKRAVAAAKQKAYENIYRKLDTKGDNAVYRVAKQQDRTTKDVQQVRMVKNEGEGVLTRAEEVLKRWKDYWECRKPQRKKGEWSTDHR